MFPRPFETPKNGQIPSKLEFCNLSSSYLANIISIEKMIHSNRHESPATLHKLPELYFIYIHIHTYIHIYIYIYILE